MSKINNPDIKIVISVPLILEYKKILILKQERLVFSENGIKDYLDYLTEKTDIKIGLHSPGTHIEIFEDEKILEDKPDYALLLAWNFKEEIMKNLEGFKENKGKFIIPIPKPKII